MFRSSPRRDASPFHSSLPLVEEDASAFHSSPRRVEVDASAFPISPARASEDASAPHYEKNVAPPAEAPSLEELWKEMDVALWEALPPAERAKIELEKKARKRSPPRNKLPGRPMSRPRESGNWLFGRRLVRGT